MQRFLFLALQLTALCSSSSWPKHARIPVHGSTADSSLFLLFLATTCKDSYSLLYSWQLPVPPLPGPNMQGFLFLALQLTAPCSSSSWPQHARIPILGSTADSFLFLLFLATTCEDSYSLLYRWQLPVPPLPGHNMQGFLFLALQLTAPCSSSSWPQHARIPIPGSPAYSSLFLLFLATTCKDSYSSLYSWQLPVPPLPGHNMQGFLFLALQLTAPCSFSSWPQHARIPIPGFSAPRAPPISCHRIGIRQQLQHFHQPGG